MDSFELNKIAGAVLFALLLSVGVKVLADTLFESEAPETPGYVIAVATDAGDTGGAPVSQPIALLLASADPKMGEASAKKCAACHTFGQGEANKVGPNVYGVVNRPIAAHEGYEYSDAMHAFAQEAQTWSFEHLNAFLHDPKATVPGTKMAFAGLKDDKERANVVAYLRTLSDNPAPLPEPTEAASTGGETDFASAATDASGAPVPSEPDATAAEPSASAGAGGAPAADTAQTQGQQTAQTETPAAPAPAPAEAPATPAAAAPAAAPAADASASAGDASAGATYAKRCTVCHSLEKDGPNKLGPHLYGVIGRPIASVADFNYSEAMKTFSEGGAKTWDEATLSSYLSDPRGVVPGTKMVFPGIASESDRANVVAYLKTLSE